MNWTRELLPISMLLVVIVLVLRRLPRVDLGHSPAFLRRRVQNWLPVGLTYAFLYMGRYNLKACEGLLFDKQQFSTIYFWGTLTYGFSFLINGPLTDRLGGRVTIIIAALGALAANAAMGALTMTHITAHTVGAVVPMEQRDALVPAFAALYALNMYFQSFGAVSIVKLNAPWFHVRERGTFGGIFGILISLGIYFAFDWSNAIKRALPVYWVFFVPAAILSVFAVLDLVLVRDTPSRAGHDDFDLGDATDASDDGPRAGVVEVATKMFRNPVILTIALIEFCSGYLRNAIMQYYPSYARETHSAGFVMAHWGMLLCIAGISGGILAGVISDRLFQSRRGPVSAVLYGGMIAGSLGMFAILGTDAVGWAMIFMSLAIIGVHGMLSGTASMDFGGRKNTGVAVGIIDGFVYLGTAAEALVLKSVLPRGAHSHDPAHWWTWPAAILPAAVVGFILALRVWNAKPRGDAPAAH
ncbi:MAG: MFS transporter [Polyangiales bacterium]